MHLSQVLVEKQANHWLSLVLIDVILVEYNQVVYFSMLSNYLKVIECELVGLIENHHFEDYVEIWVELESIKF